MTYTTYRVVISDFDYSKEILFISEKYYSQHEFSLILQEAIDCYVKWVTAIGRRKCYITTDSFFDDSSNVYHYLYHNYQIERLRPITVGFSSDLGILESTDEDYPYNEFYSKRYKDIELAECDGCYRNECILTNPKKEHDKIIMPNYDRYKYWEALKILAERQLSKEISKYLLE